MDNKMPQIDDKLKESIDLLYNNITWLCLKWRIYKQFFGTSKEIVDLLNKFSGLTFKIFQDVLYDDIIVSICKLTDPAKTSGKENLTINRLLVLIRDKYEDLYKKLLDIKVEIDSECVNIRAQRNKKISHIDFEAAKFDYKDLKGISRANISKVVECICKYMNEINNYFFDSTTAYQMVIVSCSEDDELIKHLQKLDNYYKKDNPDWDL